MANNILLITNEEKIAEHVKSRLVLLRGGDNIAVSVYENAQSELKKVSAKIVIVHENKNREDTIELIKQLREENDRTDIVILLLVNDLDSEFILGAYDAGVNDYFSVHSEPYEVVLKTINGMKLQSIASSALRNQKVLEGLGIIDEFSGFYASKYAKTVFENELTRNYPKSGVFMIISPDEMSKSRFSVDKTIEALKVSTRSEDVITHAKATKFYVFLPKTDINGALVVINKIKDALKTDFSIKAGICDVKNKSFAKLEKEALNALAEAMISDVTYVIPEEKDETLDKWLGVKEENQKNFRIFKQAFNKKLEGVIAPVFYRLQKAYEEKLFNTKIEQYTDENQSVFRLKNKNQDSTLKIVYPGFAKIVVSIIHSGLDSPENKEISMALTQITQKELVKVVEDFIKEFKMTSQKKD